MKAKVIELIENDSIIDSSYGINDFTITEKKMDGLADKIVKLFEIPDVSHGALIKELEKLIKEDCTCCGNIKKATWLDCGCTTDGENRGIRKAIELHKKHYE